MRRYIGVRNTAPLARYGILAEDRPIAYELKDAMDGQGEVRENPAPS